MSSVPVVVIVVVVIAAIAAASLSDGPKPATPPEPPEREPVPTPPADPASTGAPDASELAFPVVPNPEWPDLDRDAPAEELGDPDGDPDDQGVARRLRSLGLLGVTVVALGAGAAGLLGAIVLIGYRLLVRALG